jgi:hypothetical protein
MNAYVKFVGGLLGGLMFYGILTAGVYFKWWLPDVLLNAIYGGMTASGLMGGVHYGARYLTYTRPESISASVPVPEPVKEVASGSPATEVPAPAQTS